MSKNIICMCNDKIIKHLNRKRDRKKWNDFQLEFKPSVLNLWRHSLNHIDGHSMTAICFKEHWSVCVSSERENRVNFNGCLCGAFAGTAKESIWYQTSIWEIRPPKTIHWPETNIMWKKNRFFTSKRNAAHHQDGCCGRFIRVQLLSCFGGF